MADRGGGDASVGLLRDREALRAAPGLLSDSDSDSDPELEPGVPSLGEAAFLEDQEEEEEETEDPPRAPTSPVRPFHLRGTSPTFSLRSHTIFAGLDVAPAGAPGPLGPPADPFKRPLPPPGPARRPQAPAPPDYVTHPERWTKYSLEDVPDGSDRSNREAALEFLEDLKRRAAPQPDGCAPSFKQQPSSRGAGRIIFTKPTKTGEPRPERKRPPGEEPVALGHLGSAGGPDGEAGEEPPRRPAEPQDADMQEEEASDPQPSVGRPVGFHSSKKRSREHLRHKGNAEEESEEA